MISSVSFALKRYKTLVGILTSEAAAAAGRIPLWMKMASKRSAIKIELALFEDQYTYQKAV